MSKVAYYTEEGLQNIRDEVHHLKTVERPSISQQIGEARDKGDLSENAEYDAAKEAQCLLDLKISQLENLISNARIVDESIMDNSKVRILSKVTIENQANKTTLTYTLVAENEQDLKAGKISVDSPIGKGLLGKAKDEIAEVIIPAGQLNFKILDITR